MSFSSKVNKSRRAHGAANAQNIPILGQEWRGPISHTSTCFESALNVQGEGASFGHMLLFGVLTNQARTVKSQIMYS